ncbi:UNVERIFIED_ORG: hypothetical protein M2414_002362 [Rahnella aquatilis]
MAKDKSTAESVELVSVVVLKGKTLRHDGGKYLQNTRVKLSEADAKQLIAKGFVKPLAELQQEMEVASAQEVSVSQSESQTSITTSEPAKDASDNGAV